MRQNKRNLHVDVKHQFKDFNANIISHVHLPGKTTKLVLSSTFAGRHCRKLLKNIWSVCLFRFSDNLICLLSNYSEYCEEQRDIQRVIKTVSKLVFINFLNNQRLKSENYKVSYIFSNLPVRQTLQDALKMLLLISIIDHLTRYCSYWLCFSPTRTYCNKARK